jgi:hypothetical protein
MEFGRDVVTGYALDRSHRTIQVHFRTRGRSWVAGGIFRSLHRGRPVAENGVGVLEFEVQARRRTPGAPERLDIRIRAAPVRRITIGVRASGAGGECALRFSHETDGDRSSEIAGISYLWRNSGIEGTITFAGAQGEGSRLWMLRRPGTGIYPVWVRPPGFVGAIGGGLRGSRMGCGIWAWLRAEASGPRDTGIGLFLALREGRVVQRLQGPP